MAGIYVGEICTGKKIEPGYMKGTAEAIDWATDECDVDIISMSIAKEEVTGSGLVDKGAICGHAFMLLEPGRSSAGSSATRGPRVDDTSFPDLDLFDNTKWLHGAGILDQPERYDDPPTLQYFPNDGGEAMEHGHHLQINAEEPLSEKRLRSGSFFVDP
ncbi:hypothetical protein BFJ68_g6673 [Fusarium oxysporum]|uniref:Peptidase S8/S53 domain-containing protein n=1 Tax=Fusarium oxysporum TaxID=5507 RepID=A0A420QGD0_FUSOX|nr:hypothetical protein BFJ71_g3811 [Fusarium oxysporum]RKL14280.1 hypothetical protein BFJ68_g6673 [Fusarium oxysporum]